LDQERPEHRHEPDEVTALLRGLRLGFVALVSAVVVAGLVIGWGSREREQDNPYYGDLVTIAGG